MKLDAVVVTVAWAQEDEYLSAFARKVHITALQVNIRPPHSRRSGMWSWNNTHTRINNGAAIILGTGWYCHLSCLHFSKNT